MLTFFTFLKQFFAKGSNAADKHPRAAVIRAFLLFLSGGLLLAWTLTPNLIAFGCFSVLLLLLCGIALVVVLRFITDHS